MTAPRRRKTTIGWAEYVALPGWGVRAVKVKVDTGARTSALHVEDLEKLDDGRVSFFVVTDQSKRRVRVEAPVVRWAKVRSSTGVYTRRPFLEVVMKLGDVEKTIEITLVNREKMVFRMLLGRTALEKDFVVDVARQCVLGRPPSRRARSADKQEEEES